MTELRDVTCHMGSHSETCNPTQVNAPLLNASPQAGTRFTYPGGMEGWLDLVAGNWLHTEMVYQPNRTEDMLSIEMYYMVHGVY